MFRRTASGLSNQHHFLNVDAIVFVEGGKHSYSKEEVYDGKFDSYSIDIKFWQGLFSIFRGKKKFHFKAIGSKSTLKSIAEDIKNGGITNVYVAMDRDFDSINGRIESPKGVFFTYGYSWENDIWQPKIVKDVFNSFYFAPASSGPITKQILTICEQFARDINIIVCADAFRHISGSTFIPRDKHMCLLRIKRDSVPQVNQEKVQQLFQKLGLSEEEVRKFGSKVKIDPLRNCYGHLLCDFYYFLISHFLKKIGGLPSVAKHYIICTGIDKFLERLVSTQLSHIESYYKSCFSSLQQSNLSHRPLKE